MSLDRSICWRLMSPEDRYARWTAPGPGGCILWTGSDVSDEGYPRFYAEGNRVLVHRWAFERWVRPLAEGEVVDHLCEVTTCVNPAHLRGCTQAENVLRSKIALSAVNARKTFCVNGHEFTPENTHVGQNTGGRPRRNCRRCKADRERARRARLRAVS